MQSELGGGLGRDLNLNCILYFGAFIIVYISVQYVCSAVPCNHAAYDAMVISALKPRN